MEEKLVNIMNEMAEYLNISQLKKLQEVLLKQLSDTTPQKEPAANSDYLKLFLDAKKIEGCSDRTIKYYQGTIEHLLAHIVTPVRKITTDEVRSYLVDYQQRSIVAAAIMHSPASPKRDRFICAAILPLM